MQKGSNLPKVSNSVKRQSQNLNSDLFAFKVFVFSFPHAAVDSILGVEGS